jgi:hypothetical protein
MDYIYRTGLMVALLLTFNVMPLGWAADSNNEEVQLLQQQLAEQRQRMDALQQRLAELENKDQTRTASEAKGGGLRFRDLYDGGFVLARTEDGSFSLKINALAQVRYTLVDPQHGKQNRTFDVPQARLAVSGTVFDPHLSYFLQFASKTTTDNNQVTMLDWWMQYQFSPLLKLRAGRFAYPYSRQLSSSPGNLLFADLSAADYAFNLSRAIGVHMGGRWQRLSYDFTTTNSIRGMDASGQQNIGRDMAMVGHLEFDILAPYGYLESSPTPVTAPQLSIGLGAARNPIDEASKLQNVLPGDRTTNVTLDAGFRWQRFTLQAAGYYRHNEIKKAGRPDNDDWGYYGQVGYYLLAQRLELAGRIAEVLFDKANNPATTGNVTEYTIGLNYYLRGHNVKLQTDYSLLTKAPFSGGHANDHRLRIQAQFLF